MNTLALKALADVSLYFAVVTPLLGYALLPVRICLIVLPAAWVVWLAVNWKRRALEDSVTDTLYFEIRLLVVCAFIEILCFGIAKWQRTAVPFIAAFFIFAILTARTVRLAESGSDNTVFRRNTFLEIAAVTVIAVILSLEPVYGTFISLLRSFYDTLIVPVLETVLNAVLRFFMWIGSFISAFFPDISFSSEEEPIMLDLTTGLEGFEGAEPVGTPLWLKVTLAVIGAVIVAAIAVYIYRRLSARGRGSSGRTPGEISRSAIDISSGKRDFRRTFTAERNIRYYFRKLMSYGEKCGLNMRDGILTSDEAVKRESSLWGNADELSELRELYLAARYGGVKDSDAGRARAKEIYNDIIKTMH